ncbi:hypothetical protein B0T17DRAFT_23688 [Bombardia bombarda]|uniref:Uncharacterized protein n=1 Tax=Bombardia bombarda TaxID=252184 RepID=A0AA39XKX9_9PEZI|nr:hypothetical protein B0T17DRAFT_23688 [Bombardia bombarda]
MDGRWRPPPVNSHWGSSTGQQLPSTSFSIPISQSPSHPRPPVDAPPIAHCPLPIAHCPLPIAHRPSPIAQWCIGCSTGGLPHSCCAHEVEELDSWCRPLTPATSDQRVTGQ